MREEGGLFVYHELYRLLIGSLIWIGPTSVLLCCVCTCVCTSAALVCNTESVGNRGQSHRDITHDDDGITLFFCSFRALHARSRITPGDVSYSDAPLS